MARPPEPLGQVQLEVLQYVADHQPIRVGEVAEHFADTAGKARTTILTVMEKLREKGYLVRKKSGGAFQYSLRVERSRVMAGVIGRFIRESLQGSVSPLIAFLAEDRGLTDAELAKLKDLVEVLESRRDKQGTKS